MKETSVREVDRRLLDGDLELYQALEQRIAMNDSLVGELARGNLRMEPSKTILGIGEFFSVLIAYEVDDIRQFGTEKKLSSYIGIIPSTFSSRGRTFHGRLTKQGNKYLRWAIVEATRPVIESDADLRAYYEKARVKKGANSAKIATARKLATIIYRVLYQKRSYKVCSPRLPSYHLCRY
ncbi:MAG: IS110 family transposase [Dehalococcoidia bacterium]|nr:IS110 family transposase [Dehalococcoidia bacterium]